MVILEAVVYGAVELCCLILTGVCFIHLTFINEGRLNNKECNNIY